MNTIITNTPQIRLNDSFFQFEIEEAQISIDMRGLFNTDNYSENAWINITSILQSSWSPVRKISKWLRNENLKEYINIVDREIFKGGKLPLSKYAPESQWLKADWLENGSTPLILTRRGNSGGTWMHKELFIEFITTLRADYRRALHKMVIGVIRTADTMKISRINTKVLFKPLTDVIRDKYIPAQTPNGQKFAYSNLLNLANLAGVGMTSKVYKQKTNLTPTKIKDDGKLSIRDYMTKDELKAIEEKEQELWALIKYVSTDYQILKSKLLEGVI